MGHSSISKRSFGVGAGWHEVSPSLTISHLSASNLNDNLIPGFRFSLADLSLRPGACCPKSLANASRYHSDALAASMTGQIIVPLCSSIDVFGFRIMCSGPVDNLRRRVLLGRDHPRADVLGGHGAVAIQGTALLHSLTATLSCDSPVVAQPASWRRR